MASLCWVGARIAFPISWPLALLALGLAVVVRRPWLVVVLAALTVSGRTHAELDALVPLAVDHYEGLVALITDPEEQRFGLGAEVELLDGPRAGAHAQLSVPWSGASPWTGRVAGDRLQVSGRQRPIPQTDWARSRRLVGRLSVSDAAHVAGPSWWRLPSEAMRAAVVAGAEGLRGDRRALYIGLVIGDDRDQSVAQQARFRVAGLTHLLAVSGQNVAFALAVAAPLVRRLGRSGRLVATGAVLAVFAVATRLEASVIRATASAAIATLAAASGRRSLGTRTLGLAVVVVLAWNPMLAYSVGFSLSVLASAGILLLGPAIAARIPGPSALADAIGVTAAAQIGVAPVLINTFGPVSLASLPANVLAGGAAGLVMTWGLSVGVVIGLLPADIRWLPSLPATFLVWWIDTVASWSARLPLPALSTTGLAVAGLLIAVTVIVGRRRWLRTAALAVAIVVGAAAVPESPRRPGTIDGARWWPPTADTASVLVVGADTHPSIVESLVEFRLDSIDLVIIERGTRTTATLVRQIEEVVDLGVLLAPPLHRSVGARRVLAALTIDVGTGQLLLEPDGDRLLVTLRSG